MLGAGNAGEGPGFAVSALTTAPQPGKLAALGRPRWLVSPRGTELHRVRSRGRSVPALTLPRDPTEGPLCSHLFLLRPALPEFSLCPYTLSLSAHLLTGIFKQTWTLYYFFYFKRPRKHSKGLLCVEESTTNLRD